MTAPSQPSPSQRVGEMGPSPWVARLSAVGTLATVGLMPADAKAAVVKVTGQNVSLTWYSTLIGLGDQTPWDIDGDGGSEFTFKNYNGEWGYFLAINNVTSGLLGFSIYGEDLFPGGVVGLSKGSVVGPMPPPGLNWLLGQNRRGVIGYQGGIGKSSGFFEFNYSAEGSNFFGFRFGDPMSPNYGFATISFGQVQEFVPGNPDLGFTRSFTISSWAYESEPGVPITVSSLEPDPAPVPGPIGLAGLAAGAAWTRKLRRRIRQTESAEEA